MKADIIFSFLQDLKENNNREWFQENKSRFEEAKAEMEGFVQWVINEIEAFDPKVKGLTPKETIFRIYRDVRFSKDKSPYKTNMGAYICPGGRKSPFGGYYIHMEPEASFAGGGVYHPMPENLKKIRNEIFYSLDEFEEIVTNDQFVSTFGEINDADKLKRPPKGFDADFRGIEYLKFKNYICTKAFTIDQVMETEFPTQLVETFKLMKPLNDFLYTAIKDES